MSRIETRWVKRLRNEPSHGLAFLTPWMYQIDLANSQTAMEIDEEFLREVAERTLQEEEVAEAIVSVALVDNAALRELNRQYLGHDFDTDVLSFLLECEEPKPAAGAAAAARRGRGKRIEGEVVLSTEMAQRRAQEFRWSPQDEVVLYLVHGLLHLAGYDDRTEREKQLMRRRERSILKIWQLTPEGGGATKDDPGTPGTASGASGADL